MSKSKSGRVLDVFGPNLVIETNDLLVWEDQLRTNFTQ